ncbi:MAG: DivIVA domain-containing protein [Actinobacteria bacterium]|nr:DivIVA domain-containing protein [Actinomycetota bacterium]
MDVSPKTLREVEFREKLRGYNPDDVDEFLERVAAGLEILQERLRQATERAVRAEQRATESNEGDDAMRRTLVLAQRTADLAVQEAREQAQRIVADADNQAHGVRAEAAEHARRTIEEATREAWAQVGRLESARDDLHREIAALQQYLDGERARLRAVVGETLRRLDDIVPSMLPPPVPGGGAVDLDSLRSPASPMPSPPPDAPQRVSDDEFYAELRMAVGERHEELGPNGHGSPVAGY